jgi:hypothetical protein
LHKKCEEVNILGRDDMCQDQEISQVITVDDWKGPCGSSQWTMIDGYSIGIVLVLGNYIVRMRKTLFSSQVRLWV